MQKAFAKLLGRSRSKSVPRDSTWAAQQAIADAHWRQKRDESMDHMTRKQLSGLTIAEREALAATAAAESRSLSKLASMSSTLGKAPSDGSTTCPVYSGTFSSTSMGRYSSSGSLAPIAHATSSTSTGVDKVRSESSGRRASSRKSKASKPRQQHGQEIFAMRV
mmetsp:Transcript_65962/g.157733  ORF Transcript_65962/g.157733 Transcript_65962/m.157733 type:complete len:164 (-) Transcript_65962:78-569(-)